MDYIENFSLQPGLHGFSSLNYIGSGYKNKSLRCHSVFFHFIFIFSNFVAFYEPDPTVWCGSYPRKHGGSNQSNFLTDIKRKRDTKSQPRAMTMLNSKVSPPIYSSIPASGREIEGFLNGIRVAGIFVLRSVCSECSPVSCLYSANANFVYAFLTKTHSLPSHVTLVILGQ